MSVEVFIVKKNCLFSPMKQKKSCYVIIEIEQSK